MTTDKVKGEKVLNIGMGWLVQYEYSDHWLDFKAYKVVGTNMDGTNPWYQGKADVNMTQDLAEAEALEGFVKWDGCCEMYLEQQHFCGAKDLIQYTEVLKELHALCKLLPSVDLDMADYLE